MRTVARKTLSGPAKLEGKGLHSGETVRLEMLPVDAGTGILFVRRDLPDAPQLNLNDVFDDGPAMRTSLRRGSAEVQTLEHLLAALHGLGITDVLVRLDGFEMPGMDGSAQPYVAAIKEAGVEVLEGSSIPVIEISRVISVADGSAQLVAMPHPEGLRLSYSLNYPTEPLAQGFLSMALNEEVFVQQIAPSRTFCLRQEAEALLAAGFGKGAGTHNTLVLDGGKVLDNSLRFPDETVRHKILDLLGDLYLLGRPINGHIIAHRSGHGLNRALAKAIADTDSKETA